MTPEDHTGGPVSCEQLGAFVDGELDGEEAEAFRRHLVQCARCQAELHGLLQLAGLAEEAALQKPAPPASVPHPAFLRSWKARAPGLIALAAVAVVSFVVVHQQFPPDAAQLLASRTTRRVSGWPSYAGASEYRPFEVQRGASVDGVVPGVSKLEEHADWRGLASVSLARGDFRQALGYLERAPNDARVQNDIGLALMEMAQFDAALEALDTARKLDPQLLQPGFNRALVLQRMGLRRAAAQAMREIAKTAPGGWHAEADNTIRLLEADLARETSESGARTEARTRLGRDQIRPSSEMVSRAPGAFRRSLYNAIALAPDDRTLAQLAPVAEELDAFGRGDVLQSLLRKTRAEARPERWALAQTLSAALEEPARLPSPERAALATRMRKAGQRDQLLLLTSLYFEDPTLGFPELSRASGDPFWTLREITREMRAARKAGNAAATEPALFSEAERLCRDPSLGGECANAMLEFSLVSLRLGRPENALKFINSAVSLAQTAPDRNRDNAHLLVRGNINVQADRLGTARALFEEVLLENPADCALRVYVADQLTEGFLGRASPTEARAAFESGRPCASKSSDPVYRAVTAVTLAVLEGTAVGREAATQEIVAVDRPDLSIQQKHDLAFARATLLAEQDDLTAEEAFRAAEQQAQAVDKEANADSLAMARTSLTLWHLRRNQPDSALKLLAELNQTLRPSGCTLGIVSQFKQRGWIAIGPPDRSVIKLQSDALDVARAPLEIQQELKDCQHVAVLSSTSQLGAAGVLPPEMAWSYRNGKPSPEPSGGLRSKLLVRSAQPPPELGLPQLVSRRPADSGWTVLDGIQATPLQVQAAMRSADIIDLEVHGTVRSELPDGAALALSPGQGGGYLLTASAVEATPLERAPIVLLGACHAAAGSSFRLSPWNLPVSFLRGGARAVFASLSELPDAEIGDFFSGVVQRIERGSTVSQALRDERLGWMARGRSWVTDVVVFE